MSARRFILIALTVLAACGSPKPAGPDTNALAKDVGTVADSYVRAYLDAFPENALVLGARDAHPDQLGDHSLPALKRWEQKEDQLLVDLKKIDVKLLEDRPE